MKKAIFAAVLLVLAAGIFAQQTRKAEVEVSYMIAGFIDITTVTVDARDVRNAEIEAYNMYQLFSIVLEVRFLRWLPASQPAPAPTPTPVPQTTPTPQTNAAPTDFARYLGTWVQGQGGNRDTMIITNNEVRITTGVRDNNGNPFVIKHNINSWTVVSNPNNSTSRNFPSGYLLTGRFDNGNPSSIYIYLHNNGRSLIWSNTPGSDGTHIYTKQ